MRNQSRTPIVACALLFWVSAVWRFATSDPLHRVWQSALREAGQLGQSPAASARPIEVAALDLPRLPDGSQPRLAAQVRLNGRLIVQVAAAQPGQTLTLQLPPSAQGLLEVSVAALSSATCMIAGASERRWLGPAGGSQVTPSVVFSLPLRRFAKPLCA